MGVWEFGQFVGVLVFGMGACSHLGSKYGCGTFEACELTRVALRNHQSKVSRIVSVGMTLMTQRNHGLRLIVSYADPMQGHAGGIYQAMNWVYVGTTANDWAVIDKHGKQWHSRICSVNGIKSQYGRKRRAMRPQDGKRIVLLGKHKYLCALDDAMRKQLEPLRKPYPKRAASVASDTAANHAAEGGATPTAALSKKRKGAG